MKLILASASPRRAQILSAGGFDFELLACAIDESPLGNESPWQTVSRLAQEKARRAAAVAAEGKQTGIIIAADTAVLVIR